MAYFKIGDVDFSGKVNQLKINRNVNYNAQTNAAGDTVVDYINSKRTIEVGFVPMNDSDMLAIQAAIAAFAVNISFRDPKTNELSENVPCIIPGDSVDYYTLQIGKVMFQAFTLTFTEL